MRIRRYLTYLTYLLLVGAGAVAIGAAPAIMIAPASPHPAVVDTPPLPGSDDGGSYCGAFCGTYSAYGTYHGAAALRASPWSHALQP